VTTEATASSGSHLSIGEVLDQLRSEFPDVTISKIRFLESQGLIDPERTPSGYRRFYPPDLQRLRWILVQQRDHFLPLRVIKERLDAFGPTGAPRLGSSNGGAHAPASVTPAPTVAPAPSTPAPVPSTSAPSTPASSTPASASRPPPPPSTSPPTSGPSAPGSRPRPPSPPISAPRPTPPPARPPAREPLAELDDDIDTEDDEDQVGVIRGGRDVAASTDLTRGELVEATGLTHAQLDALDSFGIIEPLPSDDGEVRYDDEMLAVAELAAGCYRRGIEARHLKMYWHFAEREAALFAQVLLPYVKQRNPAARAKLQGELEELARLGRRLRTAMLRRALRNTLAE